MEKMRYEIGTLHLDVNSFFDDAASRGETTSLSHCTVQKTFRARHQIGLK